MTNRTRRLACLVALLLIASSLSIDCEPPPAPKPPASCPCFVGPNRGEDCGCQSRGECSCVAFCSCRGCVTP